MRINNQAVTALLKTFTAGSFFFGGMMVSPAGGGGTMDLCSDDDTGAPPPPSPHQQPLKSEEGGDEEDGDEDDNPPPIELTNDILDNIVLSSTPVNRIYLPSGDNNFTKVAPADVDTLSRVESINGKALMRCGVKDLKKYCHKLQAWKYVPLAEQISHFSLARKMDYVNMLFHLKINYDRVKGDPQAEDPLRIRLNFGDQSLCGKIALSPPPDYNGSKLEYIKDFLTSLEANEQNSNDKQFYTKAIELINWRFQNGLDKEPMKSNLPGPLYSWVNIQKCLFRQKMKTKTYRKVYEGKTNYERYCILSSLDIKFEVNERDLFWDRLVKEYMIAVDDVGHHKIPHYYPENPWLVEKLWGICRRIVHDETKTTGKHYSVERVDCMRSLGIDIEWHSKGGSRENKESDLDKYLKVFTKWHKDAVKQGGKEFRFPYWRECDEYGTPELKACSKFVYSLYSKVKTPPNGNEIDWSDAFKKAKNEGMVMELIEKEAPFFSDFDKKAISKFKAAGFDFFPESHQKPHERIEWRWNKAFKALTNMEGDVLDENMDVPSLAANLRQDWVRVSSTQHKDSPKMRDVYMNKNIDEKSHVGHFYTVERIQKKDTIEALHLINPPYDGYAFVNLRVNVGYQYKPNEAQMKEVERIMEEVATKAKEGTLKRGVHMIVLDYVRGANRHITASKNRIIPQGVTGVDVAKEAGDVNKPLYVTFEERTTPGVDPKAL